MMMVMMISRYPTQVRGIPQCCDVLLSPCVNHQVPPAPSRPVLVVVNLPWVIADTVCQFTECASPPGGRTKRPSPSIKPAIVYTLMRNGVHRT